jgi:adenylosuccinate synthase
VGVTSIVGAQWGSEGKGVFVARIADQFRGAVRTGGPNAGHSFWHQERLYKMRSVPCAWVNQGCNLYIGAGAVVSPSTLSREIESLNRVQPVSVTIDPHAVVITHDDEAAEQALIAKVGSTAEGVGRARIRKIERSFDRSILAENHPWPAGIRVGPVSEELEALLITGGHIMLEGTQGSGLSLHHGQYPFVTSHDTNSATLFADAGIAPGWLSHSILVARTYPIRVAGNSGPMEGVETLWSHVPGAPAPETTTVTGRQRRIGRWAPQVFAAAVRLNKPCGIVLTFADYLDPSIAGTTSLADLTESAPVRDFVNKVEQEANVPVIAVGTGGARWELVETETCSHGTRWLGARPFGPRWFA